MLNQTKDVLWPDPKGIVQVTGLAADQTRDKPDTDPPIADPQPAGRTIQLVSHGNRLLALFDDGSIWWIVDDRAGAVQWVRLWPNQLLMTQAEENQAKRDWDNSNERAKDAG